MLRIGITGGIGVGKSFIANVFSHLGIPVYNSDEQAKKLMQTSLRDDINALFNTNVFIENGALNKPLIAKLIFSQPSLRSSLNQIVHPAVKTDFDHWCLQHIDKPYILKESALLFESHIFKQLDKTILVTAPYALRLSRIEERDHLSIDEIKARIDSQMPEEEKKKLADYIIVNDEKILILPQIISIHNKLIHYQ